MHITKIQNILSVCKMCFSFSFIYLFIYFFLFFFSNLKK